MPKLMDIEKPSRPVTVGMLIEILSLLPKEALVCESTYQGCYALDRSGLTPTMGPLFVYEKDGDVKLVIDDGEAYHEHEKYTSSLFWSGEALKRAMAIKSG